jgi:hypothetical protein
MAVSSPVISSLQGMNNATLVQSWSVIVKTESKPCDRGNLVMKSMATVSKGIASGLAQMGSSGAFVGLLFILCH